MMKPTTVRLLDNTLLILMLGFIFLNPIPHTTTIKEILFYLSCLLFAILLFKKKLSFLYKAPITVPIIIFGLWGWVGLFFALDKPNSIHDYYAHYIKYVILYFMLINTFKTLERFKLLVWTIIISAVAFSSWALTKYYFIMGAKDRLGSSGGLPEFITNVSELITIYALCLSLKFLFCKTSPIKKVMIICAILPLLAATILPQSASSIVSLAVALLIFFWNKPKFLVTILLVTVILINFFPLPNRIHTRLTEGDDSRIFFYLYSIEIIKDHPILGTGFDLNIFRYINQSLPNKFNQYSGLHTTKELLGHTRFFPKATWEPLNSPHNMFFSLAIRTGVVGIALFAFMIARNFQTIIHLIGQRQNSFLREWGLTLGSCLSMFLVKGFFEQVYTHFGDTIFYSILALTTIVWNLSKGATAIDEQIKFKPET